MLDKAKKFYKKHKVLVLSVGGSVVIATAGVLLGKKISGNRSLLTEKALAEGAQTAEYLAKEEGGPEILGKHWRKKLSTELVSLQSCCQVFRRDGGEQLSAFNI